MHQSLRPYSLVPSGFVVADRAELAVTFRFLLPGQKAHGHREVTTCPRDAHSSCSSQKFTGLNGAWHERSFGR
jgi:hypothetical protein